MLSPKVATKHERLSLRVYVTGDEALMKSSEKNYHLFLVGTSG